jgi:hypothetical protein
MNKPPPSGVSLPLNQAIYNDLQQVEKNVLMHLCQVMVGLHLHSDAQGEFDWDPVKLQTLIFPPSHPGNRPLASLAGMNAGISQVKRENLQALFKVAIGLCEHSDANGYFDWNPLGLTSVILSAGCEEDFVALLAILEFCGVVERNGEVGCLVVKQRIVPPASRH